MTYTQCNLLVFEDCKGCREFNVSTINEKGSVFLQSIIDQFCEKPDEEFLIFIFQNKEDMAHFKYLKHFIDNFTQKIGYSPEMQESGLNRMESRINSMGNSNKHFVFMIHKDVNLDDKERHKNEFNWEIDFSNYNGEQTNKNKWEFVVIENLTDSYYK